ncbi:ABC-2 type transport system permease protein [Paenibacillus shirakamiensis]|uniref:ABC-2 type transport system permease protein n=1 Tax=Paenibacillus shirakamiensis TaxID=1265935 RepID=A0ABS4JK96_9BACL|nr:ABC transporter permease [Paenibacillus shirakamiensis]MBP2002113.1 ABC-2 type transport system permease protein [Paenibacillus shirakamiensis]
MDLSTLRSRRKAAFWGKIAPYIPYIIQSGVAVLLFILFIAFAAWYTSFLKHIPPDLPIRWIMLILLTPLTVYASFRTYLHPADLSFLLPQEYRMKDYFKPAYRSGVIYKLLGLFILLLGIWPLYVRSAEHPKPLWLLVLVLVVLKGLSSYGGWQELRMVSSRAKAGYRVLRWALITLMLAAWLSQSILNSSIFMVLVGVNYVLSLRFAVQHNVAWETLIATEKAQSSRVMLILGWFVDVPAEGQKIYPRRWLGSLGNKVPWGQDKAFRYLLIKSFVRSELFGILIRLTLLAMLLIWWTGGSLWGAGIYIFFLFAAGMQLSGIRQMHRDSPAAAFYPVPEGSHSLTALTLVFQVQLVLAILMWLPMLILGYAQLSVTLLSVIVGIALVFIVRARFARSWREEDEDE